MTIKSTLIAARKLIEKPELWIKDHGAMRGPGGEICRCTGYAIIAAAPEGHAGPALRAFQRANRLRREIYQWNDDPKRTHIDVMAAFDKAIRSA